jgi:hypothetical protein
MDFDLESSLDYGKSFRYELCSLPYCKESSRSHSTRGIE